MCGIVGYYGDFSRELLQSMTNLLAHRGPDDSGVLALSDGRVGLGHRRLSIIDLSDAGHQPMWDVSESVVIVYNGEIYNYRELRATLESKAYRFKSQSDTEVLLNLYIEQGESMLPHLNGIFSFAIWDTRTDSLFLARDGVGVKPLYYSETPRGFLFASEMKALLLSRDVERTLNYRAIRNYLTFLWCPAPDTMLTSVKKLEPGHALVVRNGRIAKRWKFYDLPYDQEIEPISEAEAVRRLQHRLREAVRRQMVADVEVGAFLSGGLDSSTVVAMAKQVAPRQRMQCFTIGFSDKWQDQREDMSADLPYAKRVAEHLGVDLRIIYAGPELIDLFETMVYHLDEPQGDPAPINAYLICHLARQRGIKVLLSGAGGDDILGGYRRHRALMLERYWSWLPRFARGQMRRLATRIPVSRPYGRRLAKAFLYADENPGDRLAAYFRWIRPEWVETLFAPELREHLSEISLAWPLSDTLKNLPADTPPLNRMLYLEGKHFLTDHNLNYTDKMSMATGVEARVPLLDPDLITFAARLPVTMKQRGRVGKWLFKKAMERYLPHDVIYRPKVGFGVPLRYWMANQLRPVVDDTLSEASLVRRKIFDPGGVRRLIKADRAGGVDAAYTIFGLLCIEVWCRLFLDATDIRPPQQDAAILNPSNEKGCLRPS